MQMVIGVMSPSLSSGLDVRRGARVLNTVGTVAAELNLRVLPFTGSVQAPATSLKMAIHGDVHHAAAAVRNVEEATSAAFRV